MKGLRSLPVLLGKAQRAFQERILLINPNGKASQSEIIFEWKQWKEIVDYRHFLVATFILICVICLAIIGFQLPGGDISVLSGIGRGLNVIAHFAKPDLPDLSNRIVSILLIVMILFRKNVSSVYGRIDSLIDHLPMFALREEVVFRKNAESWSVWQRFCSCIAFGVIHFSMLIVPLALLPALSVAGGFFMLVYWLSFRKTHSWEYAVEQSAAVHTAYNILAIIGALVYIFGSVIVSFFLH